MILAPYSILTLNTNVQFSLSMALIQALHITLAIKAEGHFKPLEPFQLLQSTKAFNYRIQLLQYCQHFNYNQSDL